MSDLKIVTPEFRGSFVHVMEPRSFSDGQDPKYSIVIALPKEDEFWKKLNENIEKAAINKWGEVPKKLKTFIKDGDDEEDKYGWQGMYVVTASNKSAPGVVMRTEDRGIVTEVEKEDIYSGAYYKAAIRPYAYEFNNSKGVAISLDNVLKYRDGEKFTSKTSALEDFSDYVDTTSDWD